MDTQRSNIHFSSIVAQMVVSMCAVGKPVCMAFVPVLLDGVKSDKHSFLPKVQDLKAWQPVKQPNHKAWERCSVPHRCWRFNNTINTCHSYSKQFQEHCSLDTPLKFTNTVILLKSLSMSCVVSWDTRAPPYCKTKQEKLHD